MASKIVQRTWTELLGEEDWSRLVREYQEAPGEATSSPLLTALEPAAREICQTLHVLEGRLDPEDIWQQYQLAILTIARRIPGWYEQEWIPVRLLQGARRSVSRWQRSQYRQSGEPISRSHLAPGSVEDAFADAIDPVITHPIYRRIVLGEGYELQAERLGIKVETLRKRVSRDLKQLQTLRAAGNLDSIVEELKRLQQS